jgi:hypothetical protein
MRECSAMERGYNMRVQCEVAERGSAVRGCEANVPAEAIRFIISTFDNLRFRHGSILGVAWKPESLSLDMWALYRLCAAGTDPQERDDKSDS